MAIKLAPLFVGLMGLAMTSAICLLIVFDVGESLGDVIAGGLLVAMKDVFAFYRDYAYTGESK